MLRMMLRGDTLPGPVPDLAEQTTILPAQGDTLDLPTTDLGPVVQSPAPSPVIVPADAANRGFESAAPPAHHRLRDESVRPRSSRWSWFTPHTPARGPFQAGEPPTSLHDPRDVAFLERLLQRLRHL